MLAGKGKINLTHIIKSLSFDA